MENIGGEDRLKSNENEGSATAKHKTTSGTKNPISLKDAINHEPYSFRVSIHASHSATVPVAKMPPNRFITGTDQILHRRFFLDFAVHFT